MTTLINCLWELSHPFKLWIKQHHVYFCEIFPSVWWSALTHGLANCLCILYFSIYFVLAMWVSQRNSHTSCKKKKKKKSQQKQAMLRMWNVMTVMIKIVSFWAVCSSWMLLKWATLHQCCAWNLGNALKVHTHTSYSKEGCTANYTLVCSWYILISYYIIQLCLHLN